ncbi:MAG: rRNA maturation RNase YbeY, partial [Firmicutes bacterium]|nr:rRNA maturation RNase YbeY [Bacillota bacterium]
MEIVNRQRKVQIGGHLEDTIREAVQITLIRTLGRDDLEVTVSFVDDEEIASLNETYRGIPGPTDVLSFPLEDPASVSSVSSAGS